MTYRITSTDPADKSIISRFAPHDLPIRGACGVSVDLARHLLGNPRIVATDGSNCAGVVEHEMERLRRLRAGLPDVE